MHGFLAPYASRWRAQATSLRLLVRAGEQHRERLAQQAKVDAEPKISIDDFKTLLEDVRQFFLPPTANVIPPAETHPLPGSVRSAHANDRLLLAGCLESLKTAADPRRIEMLEVRRDSLLRKLGTAVS